MTDLTSQGSSVIVTRVVSVDPWVGNPEGPVLQKEEESGKCGSTGGSPTVSFAAARGRERRW